MKLRYSRRSTVSLGRREHEGGGRERMAFLRINRQ